MTVTLVLLFLDPLLNWIAFQVRPELTGGHFFSSLRRRLAARFTLKDAHLTTPDVRQLPGWLVVVPLAGFILAGWAGQNAIVYRTLSPLVIPMVVWFARAIKPRWLRGINWPLVLAWVGLLVVALAGWSPVSKGSNLYQVRDMLRSEWQPGDIMYHATGTTAVVFWHYLPNQMHYLLDAPIGLAQVVAEKARINVPQSPLEQIPHRRAWIVWSRDEVLKQIDPRIDERMAGYVQGCPLVGQLPYWQVAMTDIYLCGE